MNIAHTELANQLTSARDALTQRLSLVTLNVGSDAYDDLGHLITLVENLSDGLGFSPDVVITEEVATSFEYAREILADLVTEIDDAQRGIGDQDFHEDDADEDAVMEFMESTIATFEASVESLTI